MKTKCAARANILLNNKLNLQIYEKYCIFGKAYYVKQKRVGKDDFIKSTVFAIS